jgi:hypothetical protein
LTATSVFSPGSTFTSNSCHCFEPSLVSQTRCQRGLRTNNEGATQDRRGPSRVAAIRPRSRRHSGSTRMNESILTQLKVIVERAVRPVRASTSRKRKMREELLAHVVGVFEEECARLGDDRAALERTARLAPWFSHGVWHSRSPSGGVTTRNGGGCRSRYLRRADDHAGYPRSRLRLSSRDHRRSRDDHHCCLIGRVRRAGQKVGSPSSRNGW